MHFLEYLFMDHDVMVLWDEIMELLCLNLGHRAFDC